MARRQRCLQTVRSQRVAEARAAPVTGAEDRAVVPWKTGGWNDGKSLGRMLDILWFAGAISIVGRNGNERLWDLTERWLPVEEPRLKPREVARRLHRYQRRTATATP